MITYDVILKSVGSQDNKLTVIKLVKDNTSLSLKEAKELVDAVPSILKENISEEDAVKLKLKFNSNGAIIELKEHGQPVSNESKQVVSTVDLYDVVLKPVASNKKMSVIALVKERTGFGLKETKDLLDKAPINIIEYLSYADAQSLKREFEKKAPK